MNRFQRRLALIGIVLFTCFGAVHESAGQSSTLTAFYTAPVVSMAPMWIAKEVGFFKKQGLDVKLVFIASGPTRDYLDTARGGSRMWGSSADLPRRGRLLGGAKDLVIIGQSKNRMTGTIVGKKEIASVQELKGKRLGIDRIGSNPDMFTQAALSRFQIDTLKDLQYIQLGSIGQGIPALKAGTIDALTTSTPHDLFAQTVGLQSDPGYHGHEDSLCGDGSRLCSQYGGAQTAELTKFMRAYAEAIHYFLTNREGTAQIVAKYTKVEDRERGQCLCDRV